jgi:8-oxo-dGTP pyrophosphatase MutT (NUDIX family)
MATSRGDASPVPKYLAVSCVLRNREEILLLKRSSAVQTNRGKWSTVSGRVENGRAPSEVALEEIRAETGLASTQARLVRQGRPIFVRPTGRHVTKVYPFLFEAKSRAIRLNWEHVAATWVRPAQVAAYDTVPKFALLLRRLRLLRPAASVKSS